MSFRTGAGCAVAIGLLAAQGLWAQLPQMRLSGIFPAGGSAGAETELAITAGEDLESVSGLWFSDARIQAEPLMHPADRLWPEGRRDEKRFKIKIDAAVPPGLYECRALGRFGISSSRVFAVDIFPQTTEQEPNNEIEKAQAIEINHAVHARCDNRGYDWFSFQARAGQKLVVHTLARQLDARVDLVVKVYGPSGELIESRKGVGRADPFVVMTPPVDGTYHLQVHDLLYNGGNERPYRLVVTDRSWVEAVEPPLVQAGQPADLMLYGRHLVESEAVPGQEGWQQKKQRVDMPVRSDSIVGREGSDLSADAVNVQIPGGFFPGILAAIEQPVVQEAGRDAAAAPQMLVPPVAVAGRLQSTEVEDQYLLESKKGQRWWLEVIGSRLGHPSDPLLVIEQRVQDKDQETWKELASSDDQSPTVDDARRDRLNVEDPGLLWTTPADGVYRLRVRDQFGAGSDFPGTPYGLVIRPADGDFRLVALPVKTLSKNNPNRVEPWSCVIRPGGSARVRLLAYRQEGFSGSIRIEPVQVPAGLEIQPAIFGPGEDSTYLTLQAKPDAALWNGTLDLIAVAQIGDREVRRKVEGVEYQWTASDDNVSTPTRSGVLAVAIAAEEPRLPATVRLDSPQETLVMLPGGKLEWPAHLVRHDDKQKPAVTLKIGTFSKGVAKYFKAKDVVLNAEKPDNKLEVEIDGKTPVGVYGIALSGEIEMDYERDPQRAEWLRQQRDRLAALTRELQEEQKKSVAARDEGKKQKEARTKEVQEQEKAVQAAQAESQKQAKLLAEITAGRDGLKAEFDKAQAETAAQEARLAASQADDAARKDLEAAVAAVKTARDKMKQAFDAAAAKVDPQKQMADQAVAAREQAAKKLEEHRAMLQQAEQDLQQKEQAALEAEQLAKRGEEERKRLEKETSDAEKLAKSAKLKDIVSTNLVRLKIVNQPWKMTTAPVKLAAGSQAVGSFDCDWQVAGIEKIGIELRLPKGVSGVSLSDADAAASLQEAQNRIKDLEASSQHIEKELAALSEQRKKLEEDLKPKENPDKPQEPADAAANANAEAAAKLAEAAQKFEALQKRRDTEKADLEKMKQQAQQAQERLKKPVEVAYGQKNYRWNLAADAKAPVGRHEAVLRFKGQVAGRAVEWEEPLIIEVAAGS